MGVVYKLIPEVSSFIIEQKQNDPKRSCQHIAGQVFLRFGQRVSKSSVHELLKQAHVITPRAHKIKDKFQIPAQKKAEISKALAPFVKTSVEPPTKDLGAPMSPPPTKSTTISETVKKPDISPDKGDIFLKCALWDLSFKPVLGLQDFKDINSLDNNRLRAEWEYLTFPIYAIKLETEHGQSFYLDSRLQSLHERNPNQENLSAPVERMSGEVADEILNNTQCLCVRSGDVNCSKEMLYNFFYACEGLSEYKMKRVALLGKRDQTFTEFTIPPYQKKQFCIGVSYKYEDLQWVTEDSRNEMIWEVSTPGDPNLKIPLKIVKTPHEIIITNMISNGYKEIEGTFLTRHSGPMQNLKPVSYHLEELIVDQGQWLKNRLKERTLMFFPDGFSKESLEQVLLFSGSEKVEEKQIQIQLEAPKDFGQMQNLQKACEHINNSYILDPKGRKVEVFLL